MNVDPKDHAPVVAVARHQSTPANAGGDSLPDWLLPFIEGSVDSVLSVFRQSGPSAKLLALLLDVDTNQAAALLAAWPPTPSNAHIEDKTEMEQSTTRRKNTGSKQNRKVERGPATQ